MTLVFELPAWAVNLIERQCGDCAVLYAVPWDLTEEGSFISDGYFVVTEQEFLFLSGSGGKGEVRQRQRLSVYTDYKATMMSGAGILEAAEASAPDQYVKIAHFTMEHAARYATIARKINLMQEGKEPDGQQEDPDKKCIKCGRILPEGSTLCPNCTKKTDVLKRLFRMTRPYLGLLIAALVMLLVITALNILLPKIYAELVDRVYLLPADQRGDLTSFLLLFALILAGYAGCRIFITVVTVFRGRLLSKLSAKIVHELRVTVFEHIHQLSLGFTNQRKTGDLMNRVSRDTIRIQRFIQGEAIECLNQILILFGITVYLFILNWRMALMVLIPAPLIVFVMRFYWKRINLIYGRLWNLAGKCNAVLQDILSGIRVVKSFGTEANEVARYKKVCGEYKDTCVRNELFWNTAMPLLNILTILSYLVLLAYGGYAILGGEMTAGELTQFTTYAMMVYGPIEYMASLPRVIADNVAAASRVFDILDQNPDIADKEEAKELDISGAVSYRNVNFGYKSYLPVLENVNLDVRQGEMIGLVGHSGSGKSTMINILLRFYDVDSGEICIDGVNIKDISQNHLRTQIGVVLQETFLFNGTIMENVLYAKPDATPEDVIRACKVANAHDFIMKFPDGYDTRIGQNGQNLSGGEKQRIAIARAIIHNPKILILDEATSSLDTESELSVQQALQRLVKNRTTFAIAHRLSTLKYADRLLVLEKGKVAECGTHNELLEKKGIYYNLVLAQLNMSRLVGDIEITEEEYLGESG